MQHANWPFGRAAGVEAVSRARVEQGQGGAADVRTFAGIAPNEELEAVVRSIAQAHVQQAVTLSNWGPGCQSLIARKGASANQRGRSRFGIVIGE